jgi:c-di-GMP-binding flagellar brake protein YcgR
VNRPTDQRAHARFQLFAQVQLCQDAEVYVMSTENISEGGVFVTGDPTDFPSMAVGAEVELLIFPAENLMLDLSCRARVVRVEGGPGQARAGFGLSFVALDERSRERLAQFLAPRGTPPTPPPTPPDVGRA